MAPAAALVPATPPGADAAAVAALVPEALRMAARAFGVRGYGRWREDGEEAALTALARAARLYDPAKGAFYAFARSVVWRELRRLLNRLTHPPAGRPRTISYYTADLRGDGSEIPDRPAAEAYPADPLPGLTPTQDAVLRLRFAEDMTFAEIAAARGTTRQSAHRTYAAAVGRLRARLPARG